MKTIRTLEAREIECRVQQVKANGVSLLLYKDARCDMAILDEVVGAGLWQRKHDLINGNLFCSVGIRFGYEWVWKQDVGTESNTEKEKGQASDSFKRACVNWGIGRELYTAPFIWIPADKAGITSSNGKMYCNNRFSVKEVGYNDHREINALVIVDQHGKTVFSFGKTPAKEEPAVIAAKTPAEPRIMCDRCQQLIVDYIPVKGQRMTATEVVAKSSAEYGGCYCVPCMKAITAARKRAANG